MQINKITLALTIVASQVHARTTEVKPGSLEVEVKDLDALKEKAKEQINNAKATTNAKLNEAKHKIDEIKPAPTVTETHTRERAISVPVPTTTAAPKVVATPAAKSTPIPLPTSLDVTDRAQGVPEAAKYALSSQAMRNETQESTGRDPIATADYYDLPHRNAFKALQWEIDQRREMRPLWVRDPATQHNLDTQIDGLQKDAVYLAERMVGDYGLAEQKNVEKWLDIIEDSCVLYKGTYPAWIPPAGTIKNPWWNGVWGIFSWVGNLISHPVKKLRSIPGLITGHSVVVDGSSANVQTTYYDASGQPLHNGAIPVTTPAASAFVPGSRIETGRKSAISSATGLSAFAAIASLMAIVLI